MHFSGTTTYRAVVISGLVHNDDPEAADMWMPAGSFWTQPKGEVHITSAKGETTVALVEIDTGPYLVMPPEEAFDSGERPINIHLSNIVWVTPPNLPAGGGKPKIAYLWGNPEDGSDYGIFIKLPAGFEGTLHSDGTTFRSVVIQGQLHYEEMNTKILNPGSYFGSSEPSVHYISCGGNEETTLYVRTNSEYSIIER